MKTTTTKTKRRLARPLSQAHGYRIRGSGRVRVQNRLVGDANSAEQRSSPRVPRVHRTSAPPHRHPELPHYRHPEPPHYRHPEPPRR